MGIIGLNAIGLDGNVVIKKGGGGNGGSAKPKWTGHADAEGLKAIGWTDEDIAYYQANGVNWNEEDDEWHKVSDDNKALYGVLTASNISSYKDRIVYLPKIDTSEVTNMEYLFMNCKAMKAIPMLDTSKVTSMSSTFMNCASLTTIPPFDTNCVTKMDYMLGMCKSLQFIPPLDTSNVEKIASMFDSTQFEMFSLQIDLSKVADASSLFSSNSVLTAITSVLDMGGAPIVTSMFNNCNSLISVRLKNIKSSFSFNRSPLLSKDSLLYLINNEAATSAITIKLASYAYDKWATDPDIVAALANHPNISLAK